MKRYNPSEIEPKWQQVWQDKKTYEVTADTSRRKTYVSGMFPYPSGAGMHAGHAFSYSIVDAIARFHRGLGNNVLNPMGWDAFGLPTENYAIKTGTPPSVATETNIANFKKQFTRMGVSIDWSREINTTDPGYYRWTQWIFARLFERGLAYQKESLQWWCPVDKTVLANEQVEGGHCWRCGSEVVKKSLKQWFFKITDYADPLLEEIPRLDWPEKIKVAQTNWIGRSQGAEVEFELRFDDEKLNENRGPDGEKAHITVFTTRPDTLFGATFLVLAPEHKWIELALGHGTVLTNNDEVDAYVKAALKKSEIERQSEGDKEKTGVELRGVKAVNPATGELIPVWTADYVLGGYGTGAIMAVPAHDERDYAFATKYRLPVVQVVAPFETFGGVHAPREGVETLHRRTVDMFVTDGEGNYLLEIEGDQVHFVGGGVDETDATDEEAVRREVLEETGYTDIASIRQAAPFSAGIAYRVSKDRNQQTYGAYYEVILATMNQVASEIDAGKHTVEWVPKDEVSARLTWKWHNAAWDSYRNSEPMDFYHGEGILINSGSFDQLPSSEAREEIVAWLEKQGTGRAKTTYKMRDWLISRQRYWGAPIPVVHCPDHGAVAIPDDQLPVTLPVVNDYLPTGEGTSVLASVDDWVNTTCPTCGGPAKRDTDTMDGYACSSWYLLRYTDPKNDSQPWEPANANYWAPLDFYVGGDHAVAHLLYVRFWTHVFKDMGLTDFKEPVKKLVYHGYINAPDGTKMSKSKGNVIDPLDVIDQGYGADALRTYVLFMGPVELDAPWDPKGIAGVYRFLNRVWTLAQEYQEAPKDSPKNDDTLRRLQHKTAKKVTDDYYRLSFNTAVAAMMEYVNELYKLKTEGFSDAWAEALGVLVRLLAPLAPHMSAELWQQLGNDSMIEEAGWPEWDESLIVSDTIKIAVQVNGKVRAELEFSRETSEDEIKAQALAAENVARHIGDKKPTKVMYIPGRLVSIVV